MALQLGGTAQLRQMNYQDSIHRCAPTASDVDFASSDRDCGGPRACFTAPLTVQKRAMLRRPPAVRADIEAVQTVSGDSQLAVAQSAAVHGTTTARLQSR